MFELDAAPRELVDSVSPIRPIDPVSQPSVGELLQLAGVGVDENGQLGRRNFTVEPVVEVTSDHILMDGRGRSGACFGDSGGPLLGRGDDGTVRVFGSLEAGSSDCLGLDLYARVHNTDPLFLAALDDNCGPATCGEIGYEGRCFSRKAVWCEVGETRSESCQGDEQCGWDASVPGYRCIREGDGPCPGVDGFGACVGNQLRVCAAGRLSKVNCASEGMECNTGVDGRAQCE